MSNRLFGLVVVGGILLGHASAANAQLFISGGNPYQGAGIAIGQPLGLGNGFVPAYSATSYSSFYPAPLGGSTVYSSGYSGYAAPAAAYVAPGFITAPGYIAAPAFGYAPYYGYGSGTYVMRPRAYRRWVRTGLYW